MKAEIKRLSREVDTILYNNGVANEMNALVDYGEWSGSSPDFSGLVKEWGLNRETLIAYCDNAKKYADIFNGKFPVENFKANPEMGVFSIHDLNPWENILMNLHCIFMAGELQPEA